MSLEDYIELLGATSICEGLSREQLALIVQNTRKCFFQRGECLIEEGLDGQTAYLILSGTVDVEDAPADCAGESLGRGTLVGELAMLVETTYGVTVRAKERVRALAIDRDVLHRLMAADPGIAEHFSDRLLTRLSSFASQLRALDAEFAALEALANAERSA